MRTFLTAYVFLIAVTLTLAITQGWFTEAPFYVLPIIGPLIVSMAAIVGLALRKRVGNVRFWELWFHFTAARFAIGALAWMLADSLARFDWSDVLAMGAIRSVVVGAAAVELFAIWMYAYCSEDIWAEQEGVEETAG